MTKFKATKIVLVSAIALLSTFSIFASSANTTLYYRGTNGNTQSMYWGIIWEGTEINNKVFKFATVNPSGPNYNSYIVVSSRGGGGTTDPVLYFGNDVLADDYNGTLDFKIVIHFNNFQWRYGMYLGYTFFDCRYIKPYDVDHESFELDPGLHHLYYLEVYPNYTTQIIWHP
jgi:hypothetical protein